MVVKLSRSRRIAHLASLLLPVALLMGATCGALVPPLAAQQSSQSAAVKLRAEARAAVTVEEQNQVLQKIEQLREQEVKEDLDKYLTDLTAWLLHQRGENYAQQATEANARGDAKAGRELDTNAMEDFDAAIGLDPTRWKSYHQRGVCYALIGDFEHALRDFSKTVELEPKHADAWFNRGEIQYELGQFAKAINDYNRAIRLEPEDAESYTNRGHTYFQIRRFKQALGDYSKAVELEKTNAEFYANRGDAYRSLGEWEKAANDFEQAIKLNQKLGRAYQGVAWLMATCPDPQFRNQQLALRSAQRAIELDGKSDYIYLDTLAAALANSGEYEKAQTVLRRAIETAPSENVVPLRQRLNLYRAGKPFRQQVSTTAQRSGAQKRS